MAKKNEIPDVHDWSDDEIRELCTRIAKRAIEKAELTSTEEQVAWLWLQGWADSDVTKRLHKSGKTLQNHRTALYRRIRARTRADFAATIFPTTPVKVDAHPLTGKVLVFPPHTSDNRNTPRGEWLALNEQSTPVEKDTDRT